MSALFPSININFHNKTNKIMYAKSKEFLGYSYVCEGPISITAFGEKIPFAQKGTVLTFQGREMSTGLYLYA